VAVHRLLSLRLDRRRHPLAGDTRRRAVGAGLRAACGRDDVRPARRIAYALWFLLAGIAPKPLVRALAEGFLQPLRPRLIGRLLRRAGDQALWRADR
ncbi:MAG TPA: hypothetical protein VGV67_00165, partial [Solirubrobacteraceae bacterium]|nr:hypothetical protein [Solirubrobacteraceae bacterium]